MVSFFLSFVLMIQLVLQFVERYHGLMLDNKKEYKDI
jgi:hypothetical protein